MVLIVGVSEDRSSRRYGGSWVCTHCRRLEARISERQMSRDISSMIDKTPGQCWRSC